MFNAVGRAVVVTSRALEPAERRRIGRVLEVRGLAADGSRIPPTRARRRRQTAGGLV